MVPALLLSALAAAVVRGLATLATNLCPQPSPSAPPKTAGRSALSTWGYQLTNLDLDRAAAAPADLLVVDPATDDSDAVWLTAADVARLARKPDGTRRIVLAYLSIGEAERYRTYWKPVWDRVPPAWLLGENPEWPGNYTVCFWDPAWQRLLSGNPAAPLDRIVALGFDGVYLDKCDVVDDLRARYPAAAARRPDLDADMVDFVATLSRRAKTARPGFLVVMQNAEQLLSHPDLLSHLDAVGKESLLYGDPDDGRANAVADVAASRADLDRAAHTGRPVLAVEYLDDPATIAAATRRLRDIGYVPCIARQDRHLDRL